MQGRADEASVGDVRGDAGPDGHGRLVVQLQQEVERPHHVVLMGDRRAPEQQQAATLVAEVDAVEQAAVFGLQLEHGLHELLKSGFRGFALQAHEDVDGLAELAGMGLLDDAAGVEAGQEGRVERVEGHGLRGGQGSR